MSETDPLVEALQSQLAFYKGELDGVKNEMTTLIKDNNDMSKQLDSIIKKNADLENIIANCDDEKEQFKNIQKQLVLLQKEKQSFASLWQTSQNTIKNLENEMKTYECFYKSSVPFTNIDEIKHEYSTKIKILEAKLAHCLDELKSKEESLEKTKEENRNNFKKLDCKETTLNETVEKLSDANMKIGKLEKDLILMKNDLFACKQNSEELLNNMDVCKKNANECLRKENESRNKVIEALKLVDIAIAERDVAHEKEAAAIEESTRLSRKMTEILNESTLRIQKEIDTAKQSYNDKLNDMLIHIQRLELELGEKSLQIDKLHRDCALLEEKGKDGKSGEDKDTILVLQQKFEATFQQLLLSERRNIQIASEKENLQMDYDQLANNFQRDKRKREWEDKLHIDEVNSLKIQIGNLKESLDEAHKSIQQLQMDLIAKENLEQSLTDEKFAITREFEKHFKVQQRLNTKWRENVKEIVQKLENKVRHLTNDIDHLKDENSQLRSQNL